MEHKSYVSSALVHAPRLRVFPEFRVLQFAAHTFDASLVELLTVLMTGACICVPSEEARLNDITKVINDMKVNHATLTPSFIEFVNQSDIPGLENLVLAGEAMSQSHLETWSKINLVNGFGPTETAVTAAVNSKVTRLSDPRDIGLPTAHCWIVDPENHDQLVPVGCVGEMLVEGPCLARGYVNNQEKTAGVFIYDPAWTKSNGASSPGRRFYKTGDLVRYNSEAGSLTYIGRKDTQVKFHGQRIELGEIEDNLNTDPMIKHCLVFLPKSGFSQGKLVAVLSAALFDENIEPHLAPLKLLEDSKRNSIIPQIRDRLTTRLPTYMIPTVWLCVETLPFLVSGKLDRKATANWVSNMAHDPNIQLGKQGPDLNEANTRSENAIEEQLALIWSRVLNIHRSHISLDESFLSLGGDSIAGLTCVGFCKKQGLGITVQNVLRSKSIRDLATRVKEIDQPAYYEETIEKPFNLSPIQKLHFMVRQEDQGHFNQSVLTRLNKQVDEHDLRRSVETIISRHSMLRSRLTDLGAGELQQRVTEEIAGSYRWRIHNVSGQEEIEHAIANSQSCIDAFTGPVMAVDLFHVNEKDHILSIVAHHLVVDIVSWRIILEDLEELILNPDEATSQTGSLPFQTWCQLQADESRKRSTERQMGLEILPAPDFAYWGLENRLTTYGDVDCQTFEVDVESTHTLLMDCHQSLQTEPIDVFLASLLHSFHQTFKDRSSPVIYNEGHGREPWDSAIDVSRTVGWFTILHPITLQHFAEDDPIETVVRVKDLRRRVADNGRQDFARRLIGDKGYGHHAPMEFSFNYVGQHRDLQRQDGLFQLINQMAGEAGQGGGAADFGENTPRFALFEISAMSVQGRLRFTFSFNRYMKHQQGIRDWISSCHDLLTSLGPKLQSLAPRATLSSFPMLSLTYKELETIFSDRLPSIGVDSTDQVEDIYPCSRMQQGILLSRSRDEGLYAVHDTFEVKGLGSEPDLNRLVRAWQQVVMHHPMLRTIFVDKLSSRELFCQVVLKTIDSQPNIVRCVEDGEALAAFDDQEPMSYVEYKPLHRFTICQTAAGKLFCRLEINHVSMDGSSISIIVRDLQLAYGGKLETHRRPMFNNFLRYMDEQDDSTEYWCSYLSNYKPCHFPMLNDGRPSTKQLRSIRLDVEFYNELLEACERSEVTLSTSISTAWGLTLRQFCGSNDVCFSYLASLRDVPVEDIESVVGPVITLLACRMKLGVDVLLKDVLDQVQNDYMEQLAYRNTSLIDIQHALKLSDTTLFNTGVSYRKIPSNKANATEDIQLVEVGKIHDPAEFPVYVNVEAADDDAHIDLNYWTTALSDGQAENVASVFLKSLEDIVHFQHSELQSLDGLSEWHKQQIAAWNSQGHKTLDKSVHEMFDEKVKSHPDAPAIAAWDGELTYAKLNELSSMLAVYLKELGVSSGSLVPLDLEKSTWQVVAVLAVLKAGGICVPMDETKLQASFFDWLVDNGAQVALATPARVQSLEGTIPYVIPVDSSLFQSFPKAAIPFCVQPSDDGYVAFTAGRSSDPKPITLSHLAILARAEAFTSALGMQTESRIFQFAPYTSDMFVQEVFGAFMCGGCVCIPPDFGQASLSASINTLHANTLSLTPSVASFIRPSDVPGVQWLALYGESMTEKVRNIWSTNVQLHTFFGATECSSTCIHNEKHESSEMTKIGLGNGCIPWLVDPSNHNVLVPIGCTGELVLEGSGIAHRCLQNAEHTSQSFIENPAWSSGFGNRAANKGNYGLQQSRRMFKTGDLARYNSDGTLVHLGRTDKVTTSGLRASNLKLEHCIDLALLPESHCAVELIDWSDEQGTTECLAAFILSDDRYITKNDDHRQIIAPFSPRFHDLSFMMFTNLIRSMPAAQVPSFYFAVHDTPLESSGRLDHQALRDAAKSLPEDTRLKFNVKRYRVLRQSNADIDYWKTYLADIEPCSFPSLSPGASKGEHGVIEMEIKNAAQMQRFCQVAGVSASSLLYVIWGLVLRCYTGLEDVCFGYQVLESQDATVSDILPCRINLKDDAELETTAQKLNEELRQGAKHSISLFDIRQGLGLQDTSIFNTVFMSAVADGIYDLSLGPKAINLSQCMIAVVAQASEYSGKAFFYYSTECLSSANISDVVDCFGHILNSIIHTTQPGNLIGDVDFFSEKTCKRICEWNATLPERPEKCAHEAIRQQALSLPLLAPAICSWDGDFTYSEVEHLSNWLAQYLIGLGIGPEKFVALFFEKSAWYVIAQVAVLKAGGAFVSLDPSHPEARLRGLVCDVGAHVMLCSAKHYEKASGLCNIAFAVCEATIDKLPNQAIVAPSSTPSINNAAYAIFTSGTTGKPKVSVIEHIGLAIAASTFTKIFRLGPEARVLQFSNYIFDVNVMETVITLMTGGCVCIPSEEERLNNLSGAITRMRANLCSLTPSTASTLTPESVPTLTTVIMGGEKMTTSHVDRWVDRHVINAYGPSEATVASTASVKADCGRRISDDCNSIGTAFAGRAWIVDPQNYHRLLPVGAIGELVIEGCNVGRGYLNNAEKTKEVFITNPQWTEYKGLQEILKRKERMYRTGDLVRYNSDGSLCFISRKDTQIKLNGQRVELGEVEQQCIDHLPVDTSVAVEVVTPQARTVAKCLAVFFTIDDNTLHDRNDSDILLPMNEATMSLVEKLHGFLKESLPIVMIPKLFFPIRRLPFAATGKLDRKGLRAMVEPLSKEELKHYTTFNVGSRQISEGGAEGKLRALWEDALGLAPGSVSAEDSFFGVGGDSLSAMKLVGAAHSRGIALTVADIYANPILVDMAKTCEPSGTEANKVTVKPFSLLPASLTREEALREVTEQGRVPEESVSDVYPCSPVQEALLTLSIKQQGAYIARPIFKLTDKVDLGRFKSAWQQTVNELDILRTRIVHTDSVGFLQVVLDREPIAWTTATTIDEIMDDTPELPMHNGGLLTGYGIVQPGDSSIRYFIWTIHHALYDGWSVPLVLKRVEEVYNDSSSEGSTLPYNLFVSYLQDMDFAHSDEFWKSQLAEISCSPFPQSKASLPDAVRVGNRHYSSMEIARIPDSKDLTLPELIRAAWAIVISAHTGSDDVCFGETLMGRNINVHGITDVAGPVLTTVPTRIQVDREILVTQFFQNIRKLTTAMIPHLHSGLQRIRKLNDDTSLACDFQNLLVIQTEEGGMNEDLWIPENNQTSGDFFTHPLTVECKICDSELVLTVHHDEIVLDSWQTEKLTNQFTHVIQQLLTFTNRDMRKVGDLEVSSPQDKEEIALWNQRNPTRVDRCAHDIIRERCFMHPDAPAICAWDGQLSYKEMYGYASSFAAYLNFRGVGPETLVPVCLDKSVWAIVTILAVLIAGGAFVPLDPAHPMSRHKEILEEIEARVILCSSQYRNRYAGTVKTIVPISQDTIRAYGALTRNTPRPSLATPSNIAYAIFTSGSTGRPKGIIIDHRALSSSVTAFSPIVHLNENARAFQFASLTFDAAVMEVLATLMHGGCICIPSEDERLNDVAGAIRRMDVSWAFLTPSVASIIEPSTVPSLKVLACGGEKLSREVALKWAHRVKLINGYGPTETTIFAVVNDVTPSTDPSCIGYGIPSTLTWVVDPENHNRLSPLGAIGELALEGAALAREYLKSLEKTADAFVNEPAWMTAFPSSLPSPRRIYKTGDLVRYNSDGSIEYISRKDHQVKVNGLRMELGEIEHRLCEDHRVRHAVVILPKAGPIQKRLVAILSLESLNSGKGLHSDGACELIGQNQMDVAYSELQEVQKNLESQLPIYMVPQTWAMIKKLPMLVSGKLDRKTITAWIEKIDESTYDRIMQVYDHIKREDTEQKREDDNDSSISILRDIFTQVLNIPPSKIDTSRSFVSLGMSPRVARVWPGTNSLQEVTVSLEWQSFLGLASTDSA
jgi:amino acid adenylation domain-containing protein